MPAACTLSVCQYRSSDPHALSQFSARHPRKTGKISLQGVCRARARAYNQPAASVLKCYPAGQAMTISTRVHLPRPALHIARGSHGHTHAISIHEQPQFAQNALRHPHPRKQHSACGEGGGKGGLLGQAALLVQQGAGAATYDHGLISSCDSNTGDGCYYGVVRHA